MKNVLFLDDDRYRHDVFAAKNKDANITHVYNYEEFMDTLDQNPRFDEIWLDHDLAWTPDGDLDAREKTGLDAAQYLAVCPSKYPPLCVIHSWNPVGASRMAQTLRDVYVNVLVQAFNPW